MRILHVITGLGQGGAENALVGLCRDMWHLVADIRVVSLGAGRDRIADLESININVLDIGSRCLQSMTRELRREVRHFRPDVIHCWMYHPILLAPLFKQGVPLVAGIRASLQSLQTEKLGTRAIVRACALSSRFANAIVYNSDVASREHERIGYASKRRFVIPNGFDVSAFDPDQIEQNQLRQSAGIGPHEFVIGHAGRFHAVKNQIGLVRAAGLLLAQGHQFRLVLAGTSVDAANLELAEAIRDAGIDRNVVLLGPIRPITKLLGMSDLFVNASLGEAFPNIVAEAMAMAVPVLATDAGDTGAIVGKTGHIVRSPTPESLAEGIGAMLGMPRSELKALGIAGRGRIAANYSQEAATAAYLDVYRSLRQR